MQVSFIYINESNVFGGQERYLEDSIQYFEKYVSVGFFGSPFNNTLSEISAISEKSVVVLNGNSALYKNVLKLPGNTFKVYVQHSNINDGQSSVWKTFIRKLLLKVLLTRVDFVVRVCDNALPDFYAPNKIKTIYNGVKFPETVIDKSLSEPIHLLMVGAVNSNKNQKLAIKALVGLIDCRLTVVGDGPELRNLKNYAVSLGVSDRVTWAGFHQDPSSFYRQADFLLMLSKFEAFPYVVLEAMSYGVPVIAVPVGGVPEIIRPNENGFLLVDYSIAELVSKIQSITTDKYIKVAKYARQTIKDNFTLDHMMQNILAEVEKGYQKKFGVPFVKNCD